MNILIGVAAWAAGAALLVRLLHVATAGDDDYTLTERIPEDDPLWAEFLGSHPEMAP